MASVTTVVLRAEDVEEEEGAGAEEEEEGRVEYTGMTSVASCSGHSTGGAVQTVGSVKVKVDPEPSCDLSHTRPPIMLTRRCVMARPVQKRNNKRRTERQKKEPQKGKWQIDAKAWKKKNGESDTATQTGRSELFIHQLADQHAISAAI